MPTTESQAPLSGCRVMVTRPQAQSAALCSLLQQAGAEAYLFPTLLIEAASDETAVKSALSQLAEVNLVIFISPNAVDYGLACIKQYISGGLPAHIKIASVGAGTARRFQQLTGLAPDIVPQDVFNSEALLALPTLQQVSGQRILILRGNGGRTLLADSLRERGAMVDYVEVYRRSTPEIDCEQLAQDWQQQTMHYIVITSGAGLENLVRLIAQCDKAQSGSKLTELLLTTRLVLVNTRLQSLAKELGFRQDIITSIQASDEAIVQALIAHHAT